MVRRMHTYHVSRAESSDSDMEDHIFVSGKSPTGVRKRVGDIRFWLEDRENRRMERERLEASAFTTKVHHNKSTLARAITTLRPERKTITPRRILSHIESKRRYTVSLSALC